MAEGRDRENVDVSSSDREDHTPRRGFGRRHGLVRAVAWALSGAALTSACGGTVSFETSPKRVEPAQSASTADVSPEPDASAPHAGDAGDASDAEATDAADADGAPADGGARACPVGEVEIPATGPAGFRMMKGREGAHQVVLTKSFCMDANEVTVKAYAACVQAGACLEPWTHDPFSMYPKFPDYPVNLVSWTKARTYCEWVGKRLPTEAEWEWAATGPEQYKYPWGNAPEPSCDLVDFTKFGAPKTRAGGDVGCHGGGPSPVGAHPLGDRLWPDGHVHDLAGNVWEWVEDSFAPFKGSAQVEDPLVRNETPMHPLRGGAWNRSFGGMVITFRAAAQFTYQVPGVGFRCVRGAPHATPRPRHEHLVPGWKPPVKK
jgi:formylglycine-generating enzyme required for sulfatase activity